MTEVAMTEAPTKRKPGRPRKQDAVQQEPPPSLPEPPPTLPAALPEEDMPSPRLLTDTDIEMVDRKGAAKLLGKSLMTIIWLEANDPDFPAVFALGKNNFYFLTNDLRAYVIRKAAQANAEKQRKAQGK
jgi:hypothetical protein